MYKPHFLPLLILLIICALQSSLNGQETEFPYPDPILPDSLPRIFSPGVISVEGTVERGIAFSPDGDEILFTREKWNEKGLVSSSILHSYKSKNQWSPTLPSAFSSKEIESSPAFSSDGRTVYFFSERRKPGITSYVGEIWTAGKSGNRWGQAVYPQNILNETWINNISISASGNIYYSSYRNKKIGIYYSTYENGQFGEPIYLPEEINGIAGASNPFISPDERMMVFEGKPSGYSKSELYISFRTSAGLWTPAMKLNDSINQTGTESDPSFSPDGNYLFFTREGDIYWVSLAYVF